jgi:ribosomal protein S18 acetylase RimI-like enzyme
VVAGSIRLVRELGEPLGEIRWPASVALAPFSATLAPRAHELLILAYSDGGGSVPGDFDRWWAMTRHDSEFDAKLCFCAMKQNELVGFALCWTTAFIKDLVVHPHYRSEGIGAALLGTALHVFHARGAALAALKVHADNDAARRLYERVGFREG